MNMLIAANKLFLAQLQAQFDALNQKDMEKILDDIVHFVDKNAEKYIELTECVANYILKSEKLQATAVKSVKMYADLVARVSTNKELVEAGEKFGEAVEMTMYVAELSSDTQTALDHKLERLSKEIAALEKQLNDDSNTNDEFETYSKAHKYSCSRRDAVVAEIDRRSVK